MRTRSMSAALAMLAFCIAAVPSAKAATTDPQHEALEKLSGNWSVKQSLWLAPGQAPQVDAGTAEFRMVLGHHLQQVIQIAAKDKPFEGLGYLGYDNATGRYFSTWMDVNFPGFVLAQGDYDPAARVYTFRGSMAQAGGLSAPVRETLHVVDPNHLTYEFYETHEGAEQLAVRLEYTRRD